MLPPECCRRARWALRRNSPERIRSIPCAKAVRCARAAIAPMHVEHQERRGARARTVRDEWDAHVKYGAKLVPAGRSDEWDAPSLSCSREISPPQEWLGDGEKPRRSPAALEARLTSPPGGLHATDSSPHVTTHVTVFGLNFIFKLETSVRSSGASRCGHCGVQKLFIKDRS